MSSVQDDKKMSERDCVSIYFKDRETISRLKSLAVASNVSVSSIVDAVIAKSLPILEENLPKSREVKVNILVKI